MACSDRRWQRCRDLHRKRELEQAFSQFVQSQHEFDLWFKQRVLDISGLDLNNPPEMELPDLLSVYQASQASLSGSPRL